MHMIIGEAIARAVDEQDSMLAGMLEEYLQEHGDGGDALYERVREVRPAITRAEWNDLVAVRQ